MEHVETTGVAYERSILATDPATSREYPHICNSITNWCLAMVCRPNPRRLSPPSEALAGAGQFGWHWAAGVNVPPGPGRVTFRSLD
jgi:hypothetical protein